MQATYYFRNEVPVQNNIYKTFVFVGNLFAGRPVVTCDGQQPADTDKKPEYFYAPWLSLTTSSGARSSFRVGDQLSVAAIPEKSLIKTKGVVSKDIVPAPTSVIAGRQYTVTGGSSGELQIVISSQTGDNRIVVVNKNMANTDGVRLIWYLDNQPIGQTKFVPQDGCAQFQLTGAILFMPEAVRLPDDKLFDVESLNNATPYFSTPFASTVNVVYEEAPEVVPGEHEGFAEGDEEGAAGFMYYKDRRYVFSPPSMQ